MLRMFRILAGCLVVAALLGCRAPAPPPVDEALAAGRKADTFPQAGEDWFHAMDGALPLGADEIRGRDTWMVWTGGNQAMWDQLANSTYGAFDLLKTLSSHPSLPAKRENRWHTLGLINEPGFTQATGPDPERHGLWLDRKVGDWHDPFEDATRYPGVAGGSFYGEPSGIVGLRLFPNPTFDAAAARRWDPERYYSDPDYSLDRRLVRPYRVGMACAFCHVGPDPVREPADPERPQWSNLSTYVGAQYLRFGSIFFYKPDPTNFVSQLFSAALPGTVDTSLIASDNILDPRTMNSIYLVGPRLLAAQKWGRERLDGGGLDARQLPELTVDGDTVTSFEPPHWANVPHVLKDGADSVGVLGALNRVYVSIGTFHQEWFRHFKPLVGGRPQTPFPVAEARLRSTYWNATEARTPNLAKYFLHATRSHSLMTATETSPYMTWDPEILDRGKVAFAVTCARCHSSQLPEPPEGVDWFGPAYRAWVATPEWRQAMLELVRADDFLTDNFLSNDQRIPVTVLGTNVCSPLASNAVAGHVWDDFSSATYKALPAVGTVRLQDPFDPTVERDFELPGGGRGYTRVPSLVSLWATAPFLQNNSLGPFEPEPDVPSRLRVFEASIEQLLWPERRTPYVPRTTEVSYLKLGVAYLESPLDKLVGVFSRLFGNGVIEIGPIPKGTPIALLANLDVDGQRQQILDTLPVIARSLARIKSRHLDDAAAAELLRQEVAARLLALSKCPDFVLNRGHEFGSDLPDEDKRALIAFLKTF
jgi:hypothetical protein